VKTLNRILVATLAVGTAQVAMATNCPGPDAAGKSCQANPAGCDTETPPPFVTSFRPLFGGTCPDDGAVIATGFFAAEWYGPRTNQQCIASNGYIQAGACTAAFEFTNDCPLPDASTPDNALYGAWDDWNCGATTAPATDIFLDIGPTGVKARFRQMPHFNDTAVRADFNTTLYASGDKGDVAILAITDPGTPTVTATLGTEVLGNGAGLTVVPCNALPPNTCTRFVGFTPPPDIQDVLDAIAALETKLDANAIAVAALETKLDMGGNNAALEAKLDAIQLLLTPPTTGCTLFNCKK
jgi:hypothetical protein